MPSLIRRILRPDDRQPFIMMEKWAEFTDHVLREKYDKTDLDIEVRKDFATNTLYVEVREKSTGKIICVTSTDPNDPNYGALDDVIIITTDYEYVSRELFAMLTTYLP